MRDNLFEIVTSSRTFYVQVRYLFEGYRSSAWELIILEGRELADDENKQNIMTTAVIFLIIIVESVTYIPFCPPST